MGTFREMVEIEVELVTAETDKAILCLVDGREHWIPKSQIDEESLVKSKGDDGKLVIPEWLAIDKNLV